MQAVATVRWYVVAESVRNTLTVFESGKDCWFAVVQYNSKRYSLGSFKTKQLAERAKKNKIEALESIDIERAKRYEVERDRTKHSLVHNENYIPAKELRELITYDKVTGEVKITRVNVFTRFYTYDLARLYVDNIPIYLHRAVYAYVMRRWPERRLLFLDGSRKNLCWNNLASTDEMQGD